MPDANARDMRANEPNFGRNLATRQSFVAKDAFGPHIGLGPVAVGQAVQAHRAARGRGVHEAPLAHIDARVADLAPAAGGRSEEHTSELQSRENLVCRLLLEKKK